jgi:hypothetical protein
LVSDCVQAWNSATSATLRRDLAGGEFTGASVTVARSSRGARGRRRAVCRFTVAGGPNRVTTIGAIWQRGRIVGTAAVSGRAGKPGAALVVGANGFVRLARGDDLPLFELRFTLG